EYEAAYESKLRRILRGYDADIAVAVELDSKMAVQNATLTIDPNPVNLSSKNRKTESSSVKPSVGGVPGADANAIASGNRPLSIADAAQETRVKEDERESLAVAGQKYENSRQADFPIQKVKVSVGVPRSYYEREHIRKEILNAKLSGQDLAAADVPPMSQTELEELKNDTENTIKSAVSTLLPTALGEEARKLVEVWDAPDIIEPPPPSPETAKLALNWLAESWQTMAMIGLAFVALFVARSAIRNTGDGVPPEFSEGFGLELPQPPPPPEPMSEDGDGMTITGGSLQTELQTLVDSNPEVAANVIRGWVAGAA
ncbi:MAG: beta-cystathionase, partial [Planctomycetota bacterium]